jgi:tetraacyldisaccharide-1-P 4'-kinase
LVLVTTEKDYVRLGRSGALDELRAGTRTLPITLVPDDEAAFRHLVLSRIKERA